MREQIRDSWNNRLNDHTKLNQLLSIVGYRRFSLKSEHWGVTTNPQFDEFFVQKIVKTCHNNYKNEIGQVLKNKQDTFIRVGTPNENAHFYNALYEGGAWNTVCHYRKADDDVEAFFFSARTPEDAALILNSRDYLEYLVAFFEPGLIVPKSAESPVDGVIEWADLLNNKVELSHRELVCIIGYLRGLASKETARILNISHRTIETYINRSKTKLNMSRKGEILDYFMHDHARSTQFEQISTLYQL